MTIAIRKVREEHGHFGNMSPHPVSQFLDERFPRNICANPLRGSQSKRHAI